MSQKSTPIEEPALERLFDWVRENGGIINCECRQDTETGLRGLYSTEELTQGMPAIQIPNALIVSPYHICNRNLAQWDGGELKYLSIFESAPHLFHPNYPYKPSTEIPEKLSNELSEYFQVAFFLIIERAKGEKSFFKPFLDYLPARNYTLFSVDESTPISDEKPDASLLAEIQNEHDDIHRWTAYERSQSISAKQRLSDFLNQSFSVI